jgi:hypothetical protein
MQGRGRAEYREDEGRLIVLFAAMVLTIDVGFFMHGD